VQHPWPNEQRPDAGDGSDADVEPAIDGPVTDERLVRPFFLTRGRTRSNLPIEAMVVATGLAPRRPMVRQYVEALRACGRPVAVAEVAALTGFPLGVTRVLLDDLLRAGLVATAPHPVAAPDLILVERLIAGIQRMN
jgi:hypothetical protein